MTDQSVIVIPIIAIYIVTLAIVTGTVVTLILTRGHIHTLQNLSLSLLSTTGN